MSRLKEDYTTYEDVATYKRVLQQQSRRLYAEEVVGKMNGQNVDNTQKTLDLVHKGFSIIPIIESDPALPYASKKASRKRLRYKRLRKVLATGGIIAATTIGVEATNFWNTYHLSVPGIRTVEKVFPIKQTTKEKPPKVAKVDTTEYQVRSPQDTAVTSPTGWKLGYSLVPKDVTYKKIQDSPLTFTMSQGTELKINTDNLTQAATHAKNTTVPTDIWIYPNKGYQVDNLARIPWIFYSKNNPHTAHLDPASYGGGYAADKWPQGHPELLMDLHNAKDHFYFLMTVKDNAPGHVIFQAVKK